MSNYALLIINTKNDCPALTKFWTALTLESEKSDLKYEWLNAGTYQIDLSNGLDTLVQIHNLAKEENVSVKTLFFDENLSWITSYENEI